MGIGIFYIDGALPERLSLGSEIECVSIGKQYGLQDLTIVLIDAGEGYRNCIAKFNLMKALKQNFLIVTNAPYLLDNSVVWNKQHGPLVWFQKDGSWIIMQDLTDKELRSGHNIEKIYRNGGLDINEL